MEMDDKSLTEILESDPIFPPFLQGTEKWQHVVNTTNTAEKFEMLMYRILNDEYVSAFDFYKIIKRLEKDIKEKHQNEQICRCVCVCLREY